MKRRLESADLPGEKRRRVKYDTYKKWVTDFDKDCQTVTWLDCETEIDAGVKVVTSLKCRLCSKYRDSITGRRNFSEKWINGADSVRTTNVRDHAKSDQHMHAMNLHRRELARAKGLGPASYSPIAQALCTLTDDERKKLRCKFDIACFVAKEQLSLTKYPRLCELETRHGVELGGAYLNYNAGKEFTHFIAEATRQELLTTVNATPFFSLLMDGSTDKSNSDNELIMVVWCDSNGKDEKVHSRISFLTVIKPEFVTADGLFQTLECALQSLGVPAFNRETCKKLVGIGTDGASANIAARGLKGLVEQECEWVFWMWCIAHRLELAIKDALTGTFFDSINEMLLRLYYLYEKSPKKCRELEGIITDLKECFEFDDDGVKPVRACGSRWVSHKLNAMKRVVSKYGAYTAHLSTLTTDRSLKANDRAKLTGYLKKWADGKYLLGCAVFVDLLSPCAIFSKSMQSDSIDILAALTSLLRTVKETNKLGAKSLDQWPIYCSTIKKVSEEAGKPTYQCQELTKYAEAKSFYESECTEFCSRVVACTRSRLAWSDLDLIRDIIFMLGTQGWQKILDQDATPASEGDIHEDPLEAIDRLVQRFRAPLESANAEVDVIRQEFEGMLSYASQFISLATMDYQSVWWRLFHSPNCAEWSNVLTLASLLFSLPVSNGKLERTFSQLNNIKSKKRSSLGPETLNDLLRVSSDSTSFKDFSADSAITLWWEAKQRRPTQHARRQYRSRCSSQASTSSTSATSASDEDETVLLDDWDQWLNDD